MSNTTDSEKKMALFWQYLLALEEDLIGLSRYIEFNIANYSTYSIELTRIYLSVCSEIDVVAKALSSILGHSNPKNIDHYRMVIMQGFPQFSTLNIQIPRYSLDFTPWNSWGGTTQVNPNWWESYNNVKHHRDSHYPEANLENVLNAVAGLIVVNLYYHKKEGLSQIPVMDVGFDSENISKLFLPIGFRRTQLVSGFSGWGGNVP